MYKRVRDDVCSVTAHLQSTGNVLPTAFRRYGEREGCWADPHCQDKTRPRGCWEVPGTGLGDVTKEVFRCVRWYR